MKVQKCNDKSLIDRYSPFDYRDSFSRVLSGAKKITPDDFLNIVFVQLPNWIEWLLELRNRLVKPLGLKTEGRLVDLVRDRDENEIVIGDKDKHLTYYCSLWSGTKRDGEQELRITTVVKYNNLGGRLYFFLICPFHKIIISYMLKRAVKIASNRI